MNVAGVASSPFGKLQVVVVGYLITIVVLHWCEWGGGDTLLEQLRALFATVRHRLGHNATTSSGLTEDGHFSGISPEFVDVLLYPHEREVLIQKPSVEAAVFVNVIAGQKAERSQAVLDDYADKRVVGI